MPIIEFMCDKCHGKFEELIMKRGKVCDTKCPKCKSRKVSRLFSTFGLLSSGGFSSNKGSSCTSCAKTSCTGCSK